MQLHLGAWRKLRPLFNVHCDCKNCFADNRWTKGSNCETQRHRNFPLPILCWRAADDGAVYLIIILQLTLSKFSLNRDYQQPLALPLRPIHPLRSLVYKVNRCSFLKIYLVPIKRQEICTECYHKVRSLGKHIHLSSGCTNKDLVLSKHQWVFPLVLHRKIK